MDRTGQDRIGSIDLILILITIMIIIIMIYDDWLSLLGGPYYLRVFFDSFI